MSTPSPSKAKTKTSTGEAVTLPAGEVGCVSFHDWMPVPWVSRIVRGVTGKLTIVSAADLLGHDVNSRDSNWAVLVDGPTLRFVALGCQVRGVTLGSVDPANAEFVAVP